MNALPDAYDYQEIGADAPEPEDGQCTFCGDWYCGPDCRPRFVSPYLAARSRERVENGDPES